MAVPIAALIAAGLVPTSGDYGGLDRATGAALAIAGGLAILADERSWCGDALSLAGLLWFAGNLADTDLVGAGTATIATRLVFTHRAALAYALLSFPSGRPLGFRACAVAMLALLSLFPSWISSTTGGVAWSVILIASIWLPRGGGLRRGTSMQRLVACVALCFGAALLLLARLYVVQAGRPIDLVVTERLLYPLVVTLTGVIVGGALLRIRVLRRRMTDQVITVLQASPDGLRGALSAALGDPHLDLSFAHEGGWVDQYGAGVDPPTADFGRYVTLLEVGSQRNAAIVHRSSLTGDPAMHRAVTNAVRLASEHVRLRAEVHEQALELECSRRRLVNIKDGVRRELAAGVRSGPGRRLARVAEDLACVAHHDTVGDAAPQTAELTMARTRLAETQQAIEGLIAGVGPLTSTGGALRPALEALVASSVLAARLVATGDVDGPVALTLWFVAAEGLANAAKHSSATTVTVVLSCTDAAAMLEIADYGPARKGFTAGSGLINLEERLAAVGGTLTAGPVSSGWCLRAEVPLVAGGGRR